MLRRDDRKEVRNDMLMTRSQVVHFSFFFFFFIDPATTEIDTLSLPDALFFF